ncbi:E3 ubiquitin-protein ligase SH3RF1 [Drosophila grimshawi]|uniref:RING-type E3 ubiquitin transferase n=1 Tax=Drosophila grimshawi TaxID=7222 RepID=B4J4P8_DROGR|nr:E3 ubiquitin-protein ligase SH3RF1 [Drosophila grimshawi]EDW00594.1 GH20925 [Drosophila grimshawi]
MDEHTLNDLLECSVCLERLDTTSKVLPCQHTFCRKCLLDIVASQHKLRCPECRVLVNCRIDELPPNVLLMRILEGMKQTAGKNETKIEELPTTTPQLQQELSATQKAQQQQQQQLQQKQQQQSQPVQQAPPSEQPQQTARQKPRRFLLPHAYALFDFVSGEASDLKFKKGDLILLKQRIDNNWFVGQANGQEGTFPINYVKVAVALPMPQCIAMYDFKMGPSDEEGCLQFRKSTVIHVLRRVDHNWAEGRIAQTIGIFPIAFVELNAAAKKLLESGASNPQPVPLMQQQQQQQRALPAVPLIDPTHNNTNDSSTGSSSCSSINNNSSSSNSSSTCSSNNCSPNHQSLPNTPQHAAAVAAAAAAAGGGSVRYRDKGAKEKRHSLNALLQSAPLSLLQTNRHSAEILSLPHELSRLELNTQQATTTTAAATTATAAAAASRVLKTHVHQQQLPPTLPWGYLALFPYKPRQSDELELKKGCVYIVTERCVDGWFKGKNWLDIVGVFPGNYLTPLRTRDQQQLMHQWKYVMPATDANAPTSTVQSLDVRLSNMLPIQPPDLPPRQQQQLQQSQQQQQQQQSTTSCSVWTKPVEALFSRKSSTTADSSGKADTSSSGSSSGAVGLMRRLTHMKTRSKSPGAPLQQQQQPAPKEFSNTTIESNVKAAPMHPVHVRSGSCPSQLQQSQPLKDTSVVAAAAGQQQLQPNSSSSISYGSQRIKSNKERPHLLCARQSLDAATFQSMYNNAVPPAASSHTQTQTQLHANMIMAPNHRKSQSLDAGHVLGGSNSNINGNNGASLITEAAIKASATTKSVYCTRESRFRCIVPYPPNSEIELELRPGDIIYVQRKQKNGWYKGTHARTHKTGLFPASFVEPDI